MAWWQYLALTAFMIGFAAIFVIARSAPDKRNYGKTSKTRKTGL